MDLLGLSLSSLLATFAAFGSAVAALYLLKQRRRRAQVPYLPLWESLLGDQRHSALFSRLKRILSLLLTLLIVALLVLALGNPQWAASKSGKTVVLLVDAGETMSVRDGTRTRLRAALEVARKAIRELGPDDRALVAQLDEDATPLCSLTQDRSELRAALQAVKASDLATQLAQGVRFALDVTRDEPQAEVWVVSDGLGRAQDVADQLLRAPHAPALRFLRVGEPVARNVGITALAARRYPLDRTHVEVLVRARNQGPHAVDAELQLTADGQRIHTQRLHLEAGAELPVILTDLPGTDRTLTAKLQLDGPADAWPLDDTAVTRVPERKRMRVLLVSPGNRYLEAALLLDEYLRVHSTSPDGPIDTTGFDAVIFDGALPAEPPDAPALYLLPQAPDAKGFSPLTQLPRVEARPFVGHVERDHPLTRFAALEDVNIRSARLVRLQPGDQAVVRSERGNPLVVSGRRDAHPFIATTFDPRDSDLPMRVAWPLFILNALDALTGQSPHYVDSYRVGEVVRVPATGAATAEHVAPDGSVRAVPVLDGQVQIVPRLAGLHRVNVGGTTRWIAVQRPADEASSLDPADSLAGQKPSPPRATVAPRSRRIWPWLLLVALALSSLEWLTFHRRVTV